MLLQKRPGHFSEVRIAVIDSHNNGTLPHVLLSLQTGKMLIRRPERMMTGDITQVGSEVLRAKSLRVALPRAEPMVHQHPHVLSG